VFGNAGRTGRAVVHFVVIEIRSGHLYLGCDLRRAAAAQSLLTISKISRPTASLILSLKCVLTQSRWKLVGQRNEWD
jgi:hypothetical protein